MEALPPGEYAWVQYSEGKGNTQAWDFAIARPR
jgi:outer membrane protease